MAGYTKAVVLAAVIVSSALVISIFAIPPVTSPPAAPSVAADARRLVAVIYGSGGIGAGDAEFKYVKPSGNVVKVDSMQWTLDPFGRSMRTFFERGINGSATAEEKGAWLQGIDAQERYMLVRLPEWLGGSENDISAYRAFSAFDIASQCSIRYWGGGRMHIEDPCHSNVYRPWDGLTIRGVSAYGGSGAATLFSSAILALPQMRLGVDSEGYIIAYKLDNTLNGDGVVGEGKRFTLEQIEQSSERMIKAASRHAGLTLPFPAAVSGTHLIQMAPGGGIAYLEYFFDVGHAFEGHERLFSASYEPRPLTNNPTGFAITVFQSEIGDENQAKATFDNLFGAESPECDQGRRFVIRQGDSMMARVDTEAEADDLNAEALVWGRAGGQDVMVTIEGTNSNMEELLRVVNSLEIDYGL